MSSRSLRQSGRATSTNSPHSSFSSMSPKRLSRQRIARATSTSSSRHSTASLSPTRPSRVLYHLSDDSSSRRSHPYAHQHHDLLDESEQSHHDPLHVTDMGMDPQNAKATATSMSRKFFLTPPERLQVDQSVNLMDVETGQYDFETTPDAQVRYSSELPSRQSNGSSSGGILASFLGSSSPNTSLSQFFQSSGRSFTSGGNGNSSSPTLLPALTLMSSNSEASRQAKKRQHNSFVEAFLDEEIGDITLPTNGSNDRDHPQQHQRGMPQRTYTDVSMGSDDGEQEDSTPEASKATMEKQPSKRRSLTTTNGKKKRNQHTTNNKKTKAITFPEGYDPNEWEQRALDAKRKPLLLQGSNESVDTVTHANKKATKKTRRGRKKWLPKKKKKQRRLGKKEGKQKQQRKRLRPGRVALFLGGLFVIILIILLSLVLTGEMVWIWWHSPATDKPSEVPTRLVERNHSFLDLGDLPTSTQLLLRDVSGETTPQHEAVAWLEEDPHTTVLNQQTANNLTQMDTLAAMQKFVLTTLYHATSGPTNWHVSAEHDPWMDLTLNECDWFSAHHTDLYDVCNRYHQLHTLSLMNRGLEGQLPTEELALLSNLKVVRLGHNNLTGILSPTWLQSWKNLEVLNLQHNRMVGELPSELGLLTNSNGLRAIHLNNNLFSGTLPTELGDLMHRLSTLDVANNQLSGSIPTEIGGVGASQHRALERLQLQGNQLTGLIPSELGLLTQLTSLELFHNPQLTPQDLPKELCQLPLLERLTVDCDIVNCSSSCDCTCAKPLPAPHRQTLSPALDPYTILQAKKEAARDKRKQALQEEREAAIHKRQQAAAKKKEELLAKKKAALEARRHPHPLPPPTAAAGDNSTTTTTMNIHGEATVLHRPKSNNHGDVWGEASVLHRGRGGGHYRRGLLRRSTSSIE